jgi:Swiss Army Knife RNA repair-like protein
MVDIDGVVSLFGFPGHAPPGPRSVEGSFHWVDGIPHFLSATAAQHLLALGAIFELVWCSGWEERANEHLPHLLGLPRNLPFLRFEREVGGGSAGGKSLRGHWKLAAIEAYAGPRALAWVDDCLDAACHAWAAARAAPTLLVQTAPEVGLTERESERLCAWARTLATPA